MAKGVLLGAAASLVIVACAAALQIGSGASARDRETGTRGGGVTPPNVWDLTKSPASGDAPETTLLTAVPEGDPNPLISASCASTGNGDAGQIIFDLRMNVGDAKTGDKADVRFSQGKFYAGQTGIVQDEPKDAFAVVRLSLSPSDPLWKGLAGLDAVTYGMPRKPSASLDLAPARAKLIAFPAACMTYKAKGAVALAGAKATVAKAKAAAALASQPAAAPAEGAASGRASEETDFESAKELGTPAAWNAFLKAYPTGFKADLARAYLEKLQGPQGSETAPAAAPSPQGAAQGGPETAPKMETLDRGAGTAPWERDEFVTGFGDVYDDAAAVQGNGSKLYAYCSEDKHLALAVSSDGKEAYPDFDERVSAGLSGSQGAFGEKEQSAVELRFSDGKMFALSAAADPDTGDLLIADAMEGGGVPPDGAVAAELTAASKVTVSAPPFAASYQLKGSRDAICSAMKDCDVEMPGCEGSRAVWHKPAACGKGGVLYNEQCIYDYRPIVVVHGCGKGLVSVHGVCVRVPHHVKLRLPHIHLRR